MTNFNFVYYNGEVAEWLKAHAWKACKREKLFRGFESLPHRNYFAILSNKIISQDNW